MPTDATTRESLKRYIESRHGGRAVGAAAERPAYTGKQDRRAHRIAAEPMVVRARDTQHGDYSKPKRGSGRPRKSAQRYSAPGAASPPDTEDLNVFWMPPPEVIEAEFEGFSRGGLDDEYSEGPGWEEFDSREDDIGYTQTSDETVYRAAKTGKMPTLNPIDMFFRDTRRLPLLSHEQEILYGEQIGTYGPIFTGGILLPGHGTASVARLIYNYLTKPGDFANKQKFPGLGASKKSLLSRGPEALEAAKKFVQGEEAIIEQLLKGGLSDKTRGRLRHDMDGLQHRSRETLLPFEPSLGTLDAAFRELTVYARRIRALNEELRGNGDETLMRYLIQISSEAGDIPDRFPDFIGELAENRGIYLGARDRLAKGNLRLVGKVAAGYRGRGMPYEDLIGWGMGGLMRAVDKFEPERGYRFATYAWWWIRQAITRALCDTVRKIRMPEHALRAGRRIWHTRNMLYQFSEREPTTNEIAEYLGMDPELVGQHGSMPTVTSYHRPLREGGEDRHIDFLEDDGAHDPQMLAAKQALSTEVDRILNTFSPRDADVIRRRYGIGEYNGVTQTLEEIGQIHHVTRERIRQLEERVKRRLLHPSRARILEPFLDIKE